MRIAGIEKCSFVDYPGKLAAVFFTPGCNWNCFYCHNQGLLQNEGPHRRYSEEDALDFLRSRRGLLDGVVITGGEPTLQAGLRDFLARARALDYLVKLDTNGTRPEVLGGMLEDGLVDYVAMDVKAPMEKYEAVCGVPVEHKALNESIDRIMGSGVDYEFRTTVAPQLTHADVAAIARRIAGAKRYVLQQYRRPEAAASNDPRLEMPPHPGSWPGPVLEEIGLYVDCCETRGFELAAEAETAA